ncbi:MAG TPA: GNAT family N-acetyltransferase [Holophaga sp.]|nr:GNAT family N-acetyltransferase [Holophaga sp.]
MQILATSRLRLREMEQADAPFILELLNEPAFIQNIADKGVRTLADAEAYIENGPRASYARHGYGLFVVELLSTGEAIGICGLVKRDELEDADVGYAILQRHWSRGYAVEAASATVQYGLGKLGMARVLGITAPHNRGSIRVLERCGLRSAGMTDLPRYGGSNCLFTTDPA